MSQDIKASLLTLAAFAVFALGDALSKFLTASVTPFQISFWYGVFALLTLVCLSPWLGGLRKTLQTRQRGLHAVRMVLTALMPPLICYSLISLPLVSFYVLVFLAPLFTVILSMLLFGELVTAKRWILIALGFSGVFIAVLPDMDAATFPLLPAAAVIITALIFALRNLAMVKMGPAETPLSLALYPNIGIVLFSAWPALAAPMPSWQALGLCALIGFNFALALIALSAAFRMAQTSRVAPLHYTQLLWGAALGAIFFGDIPHLWTWIGGALIAFSGIVLIRDRGRAPEQP